jgi:hypothetical protein
VKKASFYLAWLRAIAKNKQKPAKAHNATPTEAVGSDVARLSTNW